MDLSNDDTLDKMRAYIESASKKLLECLDTMSLDKADLDNVLCVLEEVYSEIENAVELGDGLYQDLERHDLGTNPYD